jgi:hypothetical protein
MTATVPGGIWHVTNSVATISGTGVVLGATPGNDTVYYTTSNICGIDTAFKVVTVNAIPNAGNITSSKNFVCQGDTIVLNNTISGGFWTTSNAAVGAFSGSTTGMNATVLGVSAGTVTITFHFTNYCGTAEDTMEITVRPLGHCFDAVNEQVVSGDINLYPNPATSVLHVDAKVAVNLAIVSPDGKVVLEQKNSNDIDVTTLANGVYMIMIYDENNNLLKAAKFVKSE